MNTSEEEKIIKNFYRLVLIIIALYLTYLLRDVLIPFALGGLLAYALSPVVQFLNSRGLSWRISVVIVFVGILIFFSALFIFLVPEVTSQLRTLTSQWSQYSEILIEKIIEGVEKLDERYPDSNISQTIESFLTSISINLQNYLTHIISSIPNLVSILANIIFLGFIMTPVALYLFMADATKVRRSLVRLFPPARRREYVALL
ncbi:MAG TPA: AI-2E family transporter, partial [Candidatus Atribacteria bacterium]|nr:AI-2E family transporter [Candidatus Atribacteria bacterium]